MIKQTIAEELRAKQSRDNRELLDHAAAYIENLERERDALKAENAQLKMEICKLNAKTFKNRIYAIWEVIKTKMNEIYEKIADLGADIVRLIDKLKRWHRRRKTDRRIIKQAKAAGVWDKPQRLGGRALELKAWKVFKIKRKLGERDADLRFRYMNEMPLSFFDSKKLTYTVKLKKKPTLIKIIRWCESVERILEKRGYKIAKRETNKIHDGYEVKIYLKEEKSANEK